MNNDNNDDQTDSSTDDGIAKTPPVVNSQILSAVENSTKFAFGYGSDIQAGAEPLSAGAQIAFNKAAQAASYAVQDALDYQRNMMTILSTVQGQAFAIMFADESKIPQMAAILAAAAAQMTLTTEAFSAVSTAAAEVASTFPK